jgi:hypothetical protein
VVFKKSGGITDFLLKISLALVIAIRSIEFLTFGLMKWSLIKKPNKTTNEMPRTMSRFFLLIIF